MVPALHRTLPLPRPSLASRLMSALALARSRRALDALDDRLLRDIGLDRAAAAAEAARGLWDAPPHWRAR
jgi:uncharacterized protein YjiS (DUF1127 family)